jgi:polyribonucleotide 5'-hydroxyl-kinase
MPTSAVNADDLPPPIGDRHILTAETELRFEVPHGSGGGKHTTMTTIQLQRGSCELWGLELALHYPYLLSGGMKIALFTWHGCVIDVDTTNSGLDMCYTSEETAANIAFINTHAQLEVMRDAAAVVSISSNATATSSDTISNINSDLSSSEGPRVLIAGPQESGKSSLTKVLIAYATKLGRTPLWVDLDPADNSLSIPGTLTAVSVTSSAISVQSYASTGLSPAGNGVSPPLVLWYGSTSLDHTDLYKAQVSALATKIDARLKNDINTRASGLVVNTNGWIEEEGYQLVLHTIEVMRINVILVMGHDRLYSMLQSHIQKKTTGSIKVIKLPRSGGVVSRDATFRRHSRSLSMKRYFHGDMILSAPSSAGSHPVPQLTPFLAHVSFADVTVYRLSSVALSASMLPLAATQATDSVEVTVVPSSSWNEHAVWAVCHPIAVQAYATSQRAKALYETGVAGFVTVDRIVQESEQLHLLCPCAGILPSYVFIVGDITWME